MKHTDKLHAKGTVTLMIYKDGKLIEHWTHHNLVVTTGKTMMARALAGAATGNTVTQIGVGTNGTATSLGDTALTGVVAVAIGTATYPGAGKVLWPFTFGTGVANGLTIQEFGLLGSTGTLFSRVTRAPILKTSAISIVGTWEIDF